MKTKCQPHEEKDCACCQQALKDLQNQFGCFDHIYKEYIKMVDNLRKEIKALEDYLFTR